MARTPNLLRPTTVKLNIPETLRAQVDLELFSELEGKVPYGAWSKFFQALAEDYFLRKRQMQENSRGLMSAIESRQQSEADDKAYWREKSDWTGKPNLEEPTL